jgi:hypothetical protein
LRNSHVVIVGAISTVILGVVALLHLPPGTLPPLILKSGASALPVFVGDVGHAR